MDDHASDSDSPTPDRRRFLRWISAVGATLSAAVAGVPSVLAFISPGFRRESPSNWIKLGETALLDIGVPIKRDFTQSVSDAWVEGRVQNTVWLYSEDGEQFTAYNGRCTHLGCGVDFDPDKQVFHCPCHHGLFDVKSGAVVGGPPPRALDTLPVRVEDGEVLVQFKHFRAGIADKIEA